MNIAILPLAFPLLLASAGIARIWYSVPLIIVISLVYAATRHEYLNEIFAHALRSAIWGIGFMLLIAGVVWVMGFWN